MALYSIIGLLLVTLVGICTSRSWRQKASDNFFADCTTDLSISILQSEIENNTNVVFSPLGYSAILTMLYEGARGNTRNQLMKALHLPEDTQAVRSTFKSVLSNMQEHGVLNKPEFKNWFYVYKNVSVETSYKNILSDNYLTIVKEIERDYYISSTNEEKQEENENEKKDENEDMKEKPTEPTKPLATSEKVEEEIKTETSKLDNEKNEDKMKENKKKTSTIGNKKSEMITEEIVVRALKGEEQVEKEMLSALSANRLSSVNQTEQGDNAEEETDESKMIIFNALYFQGNWSIPFTSKTDKTEIFYTSDTEKKQVHMIRSEGEFEYGNIPDLDATAIELPYEGGRYSLLILVPNSRNGLHKLTTSLKRDLLKNIDKYLLKNSVEICVPKFKFYSITRPRKALSECGITDIYNDAADLSGITGEKGLYLNDMAQLVNIDVDESTGEYNYLTSSSYVLETRSAVVKFKADQPFLFFLRDRIDNIIVVAGKMQDPIPSSRK